MERSSSSSTAGALRVLTAHDVKRIVDEHLSLDELVEETAKLFYMLSRSNQQDRGGSRAGEAVGGSGGGGGVGVDVGVGVGGRPWIQCPGRTSVLTDEYRLLTMVGDVNGVGTSVKMVSVPTRRARPTCSDTRGGRCRGESTSAIPGRRLPPGLPATTVMMDEKDGGVKAVVNARQLTALRTAVGSLLATELVFGKYDNNSIPFDEQQQQKKNGGERRKEPEMLVLFGCGLQIESHARVLLQRFRSIHTCVLLNRTRNKRAIRLHNALSILARTLRADATTAFTVALHTREDEEEEERGEEEKAKTRTKREEHAQFGKAYVLQADILCFATSATVPLVKDSWIKPGAHLILVGSYTPQMHEVPPETIRRASMVIVDSREHAMAEAGELIAAELDENRDVIELGQLVSYYSDDRKTTVMRPMQEAIASAKAGQVTIFKSVGLAVQDVMIANLVYKRAVEASIGSLIDRYDQDEDEDSDVETTIDSLDSRPIEDSAI